METTSKEVRSGSSARIKIFERRGCFHTTTGNLKRFKGEREREREKKNIKIKIRYRSINENIESTNH
jgi:hypothetical protein